MAQVDAFGDGEPAPAAVAWIGRTMPHQLGYGRPEHHPAIIAVDRVGKVLAFADTFLDRTNRIGEFAAIAAYESVGFRTTDHLVRFRNERRADHRQQGEKSSANEHRR